jgi:hypothetical protein
MTLDAAQKEGQALGVDLVVLEPSGRDGLGRLGMREHGLMPQPVEEVDQPPPGARRLNGDRRLGRELPGAQELCFLCAFSTGAAR